MTNAAYIITIIATIVVGVFTLVGLKDLTIPGTERTVTYLRSPGAESRAARDRLALLYEVHSWAACETCGLGPPPLELLERGFEPSSDLLSIASRSVERAAAVEDLVAEAQEFTDAMREKVYGRNFAFRKRAS